MQNIGSKIKEKREMIGMSQQELCKGICSIRHLSNIENGKVNPGFVIVQALLTRLGM